MAVESNDSVAPYYGATADGTRGGWNPEFVQRIQRVDTPNTSGISCQSVGLMTDRSCDSIRFFQLEPIHPTGS